MRRILLPLVALLLAGTATFAARGWLERASGRPVAEPRQSRSSARPCWWPRPTSPSAPSSSRTRCAGRTGRTSRVPDDLPRARRRPTRPQLVGAVVRQPLAAGQPITASRVVKPGERGFLAAVLEPGMRAISVPGRRGRRQCRPDLPGRPGRPDPDPDASTPRATRRARAGSARPCSRTCASSPWAGACQRLTARRARRPAGPHGDARGHAGGGGEDRARGRARQARPEPAQPRPGPTRDGARSGRARSPGTATPARRCARRTSQRTSLAVMRGDKLETVSIRRGAGS